MKSYNCLFVTTQPLISEQDNCLENYLAYWQKYWYLNKEIDDVKNIPNNICAFPLSVIKYQKFNLPSELLNYNSLLFVSPNAINSFYKEIINNNLIDLLSNIKYILIMGKSSHDIILNISKQFLIHKECEFIYNHEYQNSIGLWETLKQNKNLGKILVIKSNRGSEDLYYKFDKNKIDYSIVQSYSKNLINFSNENIHLLKKHEQINFYISSSDIYEHLIKQLDAYDLNNQHIKINICSHQKHLIDKIINIHNQEDNQYGLILLRKID